MQSRQNAEASGDVQGYWLKVSSDLGGEEQTQGVSRCSQLPGSLGLVEKHSPFSFCVVGIDSKNKGLKL